MQAQKRVSQQGDTMKHVLKGKILPGAIRTVCCVCGDLIKDGPTVDGQSSHGICSACEPKMLADIDRELADGVCG